MKSILDIIQEEISEFNRTVFTDVPQDLYIHFRQSKFSDDANKSHMKIFRSKDGRDFLVKKTINQDIFHVYDFSNLQKPIATAVFDVQNDHFSGYEHRQSIEVNPNYRRIGIATAITDFAENIYNLPYKPTGLQSTEMQGFTQNRFNGDTNDPDELQEGWLGGSKVDKFNENFYNWFGQSKVVDRSGKPLRVYHGTQADFDKFESKTGMMYFSKTPKYASNFATDPSIKGYHSSGSQPSVMPVYLSIQKPLDLTEFKTEVMSPYEFAAELEDRGVEIDSSNLRDTPWSTRLGSGDDTKVWQWLLYSNKYLLPIIKASGYDGIFMYENAETSNGKDIKDIAYVIFEPTQVKSATGNNGEFNPQNPDITKESIEMDEVKNNTKYFNENFWKWFGNSKVVDKSGKPLIMHHGGSFSPSIPSKGFTNPFNEFKGNGWFTSSKADARYYAKQTDGNLTNVYLSIQNPLYSGRQEDGSYIETNDAVIVAQKSGKYDGVIDMENGEILDAIVWDSKKIKSATENNGEFSTSNPDITQESLKEQIIKELSLLTESTDEGVADKYAERMFNIPSDLKGQEQQASAEIQKNLEEPVGYVKEIKYDYKNNNHKFLDKVPVYMNPKSLTYIDGYVRAIVDTQGNLYVAQRDGKFAHGDISVAVGLHDKTDAIYVETDRYTLLGRIGEKDAFGLGDTAEHYIKRNNEYYEIVHEMLVNAKKKNPEYDFYEAYYEDQDLGEPVDPNEEKNQHPELQKFSYDELIREEIENIVDGVADKYAERQFGIPDQSKQQDYKATIATPVEDNSMGEHIGDVTQYGNDDDDYQYHSGEPMNLEVESRIFANPRNLDKFGIRVRAVSDDQGNLFVAETDGRFFHDGIEHVVMNSKYGNSTTSYMQWYRQGSSNMFTWSSTYSGGSRLKPQEEQQYLQTLKDRNPQYKFLVPQQQVAGQNVQEEIAIEGVGDKYAEKQFGIPDNTKTVDAPGEKPFMTMTVEVPDWMITGGRTEHIPVYLNPRSLNGFQSDVRAISDTQGNLYVAQLDGHFIHSDMGEQLGLTPDDLHQSVYHQMNNFQLLHRVGDDNSFGLADSTSNYARQDAESKKAGIDLLRKVKVKNPQYEYYPEYYRNVEAYDSDPISADGNDIYADNNYDGDNIGDDNGLTTKDVQESIEEQIIYELQTLVEGVADKYAERAFNISDPTKAADQRATAGIKDLPDEPKDTSMGEFVGEFPVFDHGKYQQVPVYMNPRTLDKFEEDVKAVSNKNGDIFIAQLDLAFYHDDIINSVKGGNVYPQPVYNAYDESENITWHRIGNGNEFGWSVSYKKFGYKPENRKYVAMMMQAVMKKNPRYRFIPQYWMETKQQRYDASHNVNSDSLLNYESIVKEELQALSHVATEGVADKYAEREFNIPDPNVAMNQRANAAIPSLSKGEYIGDVTIHGGQHSYSKVYLNPQTLQYFAGSVRALTSTDGDLFVCETSGDFYHKDVEKVADEYYRDKYYDDNGEYVGDEEDRYNNQDNSNQNDNNNSNVHNSDVQNVHAGINESYYDHREDNDYEESPDINRDSYYAGWYRNAQSNEFNAAGSNSYKSRVAIDDEYIDLLKQKHPNFDFKEYSYRD